MRVCVKIETLCEMQSKGLTVHFSSMELSCRLWKEIYGLEGSDPEYRTLPYSRENARVKEEEEKEIYSMKKH